MNSTIHRLATRLALVLTVCMFVFESAALAQSPAALLSSGRTARNAPVGRSASSNCKQAKGYFFDTFDLNLGGTTGTITMGGSLNGTTTTVYNPAAVFTPDPNVVSYIAELTITTQNGQLKTDNVYIYNFATRLWTAMGNINPASSTGSFQGATGVLYFNGSTIGLFPDESYPSDVAGEICYAK